jgi:Domain of unknown function (DUF4082)
VTAYTLFAQNAHGLANLGNSGAFTLGVEFEVSSTVTLTGIWWYSSGAASLPSSICLYDANAETQIAGTLNTSPSWSGAAGSGWVKCTYSGPSLSSGTKYVAAVYDVGGDSWFCGVSGYWTSGGGSSGITNGPLSAPSSAGSVHGQAVYNSGTGLTFPASTNGGYDFGVDVEVSSGGGSPHSSTATLTVTPGLTADAVRGGYRTAALTVTPGLTADAVRAGYRTAALTVTPGLTADATHGVTMGAALAVTPVFTAAAMHAATAGGSLAVTPVFTARGGHPAGQLGNNLNQDQALYSPLAVPPIGSVFLRGAA